VLALGEVERGDDPIALEPLVHPKLVADVLALEHQKLRVELLFEFPLPLEGEVGRADDQDALSEAAELQLADQESGHDGFPCAGVAGEKKPDPRDLEEVVVDRLELVRERVHTRDREAEVWVEFVGDTQRVGLKAKPKQLSVSIEGQLRADDGELL